jgi:hypothetical protein
LSIRGQCSFSLLKSDEICKDQEKKGYFLFLDQILSSIRSNDILPWLNDETRTQEEEEERKNRKKPTKLYA